MFGGFGVDSNGKEGLLNDLWKYNPNSKAWAWMGGATTRNTPSVFGTQRVPAPDNTPGGRYLATSSADSSGNLWLFGGVGGGASDNNPGRCHFNDLWKYDVSRKQWTWLSGSDIAGVQGVYGIRGVSAPGNVPGARDLGVSWIDEAGNFWLFGGWGRDSSGVEDRLNDLWKFSPDTGQWTWASGSRNASARGVYGRQGIPASSNVPGARFGAVAWSDHRGDLWLFGGSGVDAAGAEGQLNDLWKYSPATGEWTWVSGSCTVDAPDEHGTQGIPAFADMPPAREQAVAWADGLGKVWLFGGIRGDSEDLYDLWRAETPPIGGQ